MASDDVPDNEQPEIIPKPPSHPITTALLVTNFFGIILCIGFVWAELFGCYMFGAKVRPEPGMEKHGFDEIKNNRTGQLDHYGEDFQVQGKAEANEKDMLYSVKKELHLLAEQQDSAGGGAPAGDK
ncbi:MAG TPA: hypothetical protein VFF73_11440 [Planctomycetota bacterium]|nr:hypothetical protein [Planctomycetota bacterium]